MIEMQDILFALGIFFAIVFSVAAQEWATRHLDRKRRLDERIRRVLAEHAVRVKIVPGKPTHPANEPFVPQPENYTLFGR